MLTFSFQGTSAPLREAAPRRPMSGMPTQRRSLFSGHECLAASALTLLAAQQKPRRAAKAARYAGALIFCVDESHLSLKLILLFEPVACTVKMRHSGAISRRKRSEEFLFHEAITLKEPGASTSTRLSSSEVMSGFVATSVGSLMALQAGSGSGVMMACIPFLPAFSQGNFDEAISQAPGQVSQRLRLLSHLVNGAALAQLTTALLQFALNDPLSGLIGGGIAAIGCQTAHPAGFRLLPTYVVLSFCHGIMQVLLNFQLLASGVPLKAMTAVQAGFMGKVAVGTLLASPVVMFLGMGTGYWLHKESQQLLRNIDPPAPAVPLEPRSPPAVAAPPAPPTPMTPTATEELSPPPPKKAARHTGSGFVGRLNTSCRSSNVI
eukprot:symbB.v1.2.014051.t1/scaffold1013.1/size144304/5